MKKLHVERIGSLIIALDESGQFFALALWIEARQGVCETFPVLLASAAREAPRVDARLMAAALERSPRVRKLLCEERL